MGPRVFDLRRAYLALEGLALPFTTRGTGIERIRSPPRLGPQA